MRISVSDAKGKLTDLVRRAETGEEVILTRHGYAAVRLTPISVIPQQQSRRSLIEAIQASAAMKATAEPDAARSQDHLYDENGLPL